LHSFTSTVFAALIRIMPTRPDSRVAGHPAATPSLVAAPVSVNVNKLQQPSQMGLKSSVAAAVKNVGPGCH
jgi:hypothetical protein